MLNHLIMLLTFTEMMFKVTMRMKLMVIVITTLLVIIAFQILILAIITCKKVSVSEEAIITILDRINNYTLGALTAHVENGILIISCCW